MAYVLDGWVVREFPGGQIERWAPAAESRCENFLSWILGRGSYWSMTAASHPISQAFDSIVAALCDVVAVHCEKNRAVVPIFRLLWARFHRTAARFEALFTRWCEGRLPAPRNPAPQNSHAQNPHDQPRPDREPGANDPLPVLPRRHGWLASLVPQAEVFGTQLRYLLTDPDLATFLAEVPQAGRMLLPLCRMLGVKPLPQMLPLKRPKPAPTPTEQPAEHRPPSAAKLAKQARKRWFAENIAPRPRPLIPGEDLRHVRPVSLWCRPA
jgi:hypothetical protein